MNNTWEFDWNRDYDPKLWFDPTVDFDYILLDHDGNFRPSFLKILKEIFRRFDIDNDNRLNDSELSAFSTACNGKPFDEVVLQDMRHFLTVDKDGCLLEEGFLQMYSLQTVTDPKETWHDLQQLGYSKEDFDLPEFHSSDEEDDRSSVNVSRQISAAVITTPKIDLTKKLSTSKLSNTDTTENKQTLKQMEVVPEQQSIYKGHKFNINITEESPTEIEIQQRQHQKGSSSTSLT